MKTQRSPLVSVVIPALNESATIEEVINEVKHYSSYPTEIIVVDGGSHDGTPEKAERNGAKLIVDERRGYGRAIKTGFKNATGDIIVTVDADGTYDVSDLPKLIELLLKDEADLVLASRMGGTILPGAMPGLNYVGNRLLTFAYNILYDQHVMDTQTGFRALRRDVMQKMTLKDDLFPFCTELLTEAAKKKLRIIEIPTVYKLRRGKSKLHRFRAGFQILGTLIKSKF